MEAFILVIHLLLAIAMVGVILLQRSEGGGLGIGGSGGGGGGGFMTGRDTANLLTRATAILAVGFIITSMTLAIMASNSSKQGSILDSPVPIIEKVPKPSVPSAPLAN